MDFDYGRFVYELRELFHSQPGNTGAEGYLWDRMFTLTAQLEQLLVQGEANELVLRFQVDQIMACGRDLHLASLIAPIVLNSTDVGARHAVSRRSARGNLPESSQADSIIVGRTPATKPVDQSPSTDSTPSREIRVIGRSQSGASVRVFHPTTRYTLDFSVGMPSADNLAQGEIDVNDVPAEGLNTTWIVTSSDVQLLKTASPGTVREVGETWVARFDLPIPARGESAVVSVEIFTRDTKGHLMVTILVGGEEYRKADVTLASRLKVDSDVTCTDLKQMNLRTPHEWATPPEHIGVNISGNSAYVSTIYGIKDYGTVAWLAHSAALKNPIDNVRRELELFRVAAEVQLEALDIDDMRRRLTGEDWKPAPYGWKTVDDAATFAADPSWSSKLRDLANAGYRLFDACFPADTDLRNIIEGLAPGSRIDFIWTQRGGADWVAHVPWALMYTRPLRSDEVVDCELFLGLRYRIGSKSFETKALSRALGAPETVSTLNFLYWGTDANDDVGKQSQWQREEFGRWSGHCFVPQGKTTPPREQVLKALDDPSPKPAGILYFYCHCTAGDGGDPILQFSDEASADDIIKADGIYLGTLVDGPLVFLNACMSAAGNPLATSELEARFFKRQIRGFIGTETKVPVALASRFAWLFFQFFQRKIDPSSMAAGEALAQSRLFLWTQYRNLGGLFYCLVNGYDLQLESKELLAQLSRNWRSQ